MRCLNREHVCFEIFPNIQMITIIGCNLAMTQTSHYDIYQQVSYRDADYITLPSFSHIFVNI